MSDIKRYGLHYNYENGFSCVAPKADGVYVLYTDHVKTQEMLQEVERQRRELQRQLDRRTEDFKRSRSVMWSRLDYVEKQLHGYKETLKDDE